MLIFLLLVAVSGVFSEDQKQPVRPICGRNEKYFPVIPCPPRDCANPYTSYKCDGLPKPRGPGCDCIDGYLRGPDKRCRPKENCPPRSQTPKCPANERWARCSYQCSNAFCPIDDSRGQLRCTPPRSCRPGCVCKIGFRRRDRKNPKSKCIPAEDCPKQKCRRDNEKWDRCPRCLSESCADAHRPKPTTCNELIKNCQPQCVCIKDHFRNLQDKCVHKKHCPKSK